MKRICLPKKPNENIQLTQKKTRKEKKRNRKGRTNRMPKQDKNKSEYIHKHNMYKLTTIIKRQMLSPGIKRMRVQIQLFTIITSKTY